jgi:hypothetical protein
MSAILILAGLAAALVSEASGEASVSLTGAASLEGGQLLVRYQVTNTGKVTVFVRDVMPGYGAAGMVVNPSSAYAFHEPPESLRLVRAELQIPEELDVAKKEVPFARMLAPGASLEGRIALDAPVRETSPFYPPPELWRDVTCRRVRLVIGWIEAKDGLIPQPRKVGDVEVLALKGGWAPPLQRLAETSFAIEVPVRRREGTFDRRMPLE